MTQLPVHLVLMFHFFDWGMAQMVQRECPTNVITSSLTMYDGCLNQLLDGLFFSVSTTELQRMCDNQVDRNVDWCQQNLERGLSACADGNQRSLLDTMKSAGKYSISYLCQNSGNRLKEFRESGGTSCLSSTVRRQKDCVDQHPLLSLYIDRYEGNFCTYQQPQGLGCLKDVLRNNCQQSPADFLVGYYEAMVAATPCGGSGAAILARADVLVCILMLVVSTFHKRF